MSNRTDFGTSRFIYFTIFIALGLGSRYRDLNTYFNIATLTETVNLHCMYLN